MPTTQGQSLTKPPVPGIITKDRCVKKPSLVIIGLLTVRCAAEFLRRLQAVPQTGRH